jgi:hypothetical protein
MSKPYNRTARPWDLFNPAMERVSDEIADKRMSICKQCPELINTTNQCKKCGCLMNFKTKLAIASCPLNKWEQVENVK